MTAEGMRRHFDKNLTKIDRANLAGVIYLEGQGGLISRFIMGITRFTAWVIGLLNLLTTPEHFR